MLRRIPFLVAVILLLVLTRAAVAQDPVLPTHSDPAWQAAYWNNTSFSGSPVLQRTEADLNYDWGTGSPDIRVNSDGFSARWTRYFDMVAGTYRFTATSDDGIRVWVDGDLIIDEWDDHPAKTVSAEKHLSAGHHWIVVEYYENKGFAVAKLTWGIAEAPIQNWRGEYYNNSTLAGAPALVRDDAQVNFDWEGGSPAPGVSADRFSARWTRTMNLPAGRYRFSMTVDDGGRLWVNGHLLVDSWQDQAARTYTGEIYLPGGSTSIKMEYYENGGQAVAKLSWEQLSSSIQGWRGEYFNDTALTGTPALVRDDPRIDFDWGNGSPSAGQIGSDEFSVRWTRSLDLPAGWYRFKMTVDDGGRLWIDGRLLIDAWRDQAARTYSEEIYLSGGSVPLKMEYYEHGGLAVAALSWEQASTPISNWRGEYYGNTSLNGAPALVRDDVQIDFNWDIGSPAPGKIGTDGFSVRWTRAVDLPAGRYRFAMTVDDGGRLWVNDHLLIDAWRDQPARTYTGAIDLPGGPVSIKMEYYENSGHAVAQLSWSLDSGEPGVVTVDDSDPGFAKGGAPAGWRNADEGYGGHLTWTWNNDWQRPYFNWARWYPVLTAGRYEVFVYIPDRYTTTDSARYLVSHAAGYTSRSVSQSANGDRWVSLGTYWFDGDKEEYVALDDATGESRRSRLIAFDAVKWVPR